MNRKKGALHGVHYRYTYLQNLWISDEKDCEFDSHWLQKPDKNFDRNNQFLPYSGILDSVGLSDTASDISNTILSSICF